MGRGGKLGGEGWGEKITRRGGVGRKIIAMSEK